jgi:hypothetical protein
MTFSSCDLVDRDLKQTAEPVAVQQLVADAPDDPPYILSVGPRQPAGRRLVVLRRLSHGEVLEVGREPVARERHAFDVHAMRRADQRRSVAPTSRRQAPRSS